MLTLKRNKTLTRVRIEKLASFKREDLGKETGLTQAEFASQAKSRMKGPLELAKQAKLLSSSLATESKQAKNKTNGPSRFLENSKQQLSITYEEIGLFPRSFNRVFDRFFKQVFSDVENLVIQEYRFYRYLFLTTVKCLFILFFFPFLIHFFSKNYLVRPITEYYWNSKQSEIFLNSHQQKLAFHELQEFEEKFFFESLIADNFSNQEQSLNYSPQILKGLTLPALTDATELENPNSEKKLAESLTPSLSFLKGEEKRKEEKQDLVCFTESTEKEQKNNSSKLLKGLVLETNHYKAPDLRMDACNLKTVLIEEKKTKSTMQRNDIIKQNLQEKTKELALRYNNQSIEAITNFFADLISLGTLVYLFFRLSIQINITKSFLLEVFFGLDDSKKSLLILFVTDLSVGYHSPNIWELFFQFFFFHYGIPESERTIFLLVATLPVLLDVLFKYLIFRHLNRASPATVATYHAMIE
uniref:chloroplast envelope membrane protein n=1 Tax=Parallela transversalis TaxID=163324 RepID=UPI0010C2FD99|nr:chloroplast envelope membrane protein [Parallela transversalis]AYQ22873.1 chloroplast envelope membrane protein [Parallela transversalis]